MPPQPIAFLFSPFYSIGDIHGNGWSLFISFAPRIMIGVAAGFSFKLISKRQNSKNTLVLQLSYIVSGALGSLANTVLTLASIYLFFAKEFVAISGGNPSEASTVALAILGGIFLSNGAIEAIICAVSAVFICQPLRRILARSNPH
jgi:uncharacterized membrane protein